VEGYNLSEVFALGYRDKIEYAYVFYNKKALLVQGDEGIVNIASAKVQFQKYTSYSVVHNHPNSSAFSHDDMDAFLKDKKNFNTAVCGRVGNLFFLQKSKLFFHYADEGKRNELYDTFLELLTNIANEYFDSMGHTVYTFKESFDDEMKFKAERVIFDSAFIAFCTTMDDKGFKYYIESE
jgi:hypothetical protein